MCCSLLLCLLFAGCAVSCVRARVCVCVRVWVCVCERVCVRRLLRPVLCVRVCAARVAPVALVFAAYSA